MPWDVEAAAISRSFGDPPWGQGAGLGGFANFSGNSFKFSLNSARWDRIKWADTRDAFEAHTRLVR
jgi:hypothetical protein